MEGRMAGGLPLRKAIKKQNVSVGGNETKLPTIIRSTRRHIPCPTKV